MTKPVRENFTLDLLGWSPWIERATETDISPELKAEIAAFVPPGPSADYGLVLSNDFAAYKTRAKVHRHIFTSNEPEESAFRELGATTASRINGCVFCASVHARMYANFSKKRELAQRFLDDGIDAELPDPERAVVDLAAKITLDPESLTSADLEPVRSLGFDDLSILDVINYSAFFANANRLMLTLGEPVLPATRASS
jgi:uncharacterized peroxidase-related enzyme